MEKEIVIGNKYWWPAHPYKEESLEVTILDGPMKSLSDKYYWVEDSNNQKYWVNARDITESKPTLVVSNEPTPEIKRYFRVEGNIIYPDDTMLTWGPFYYHSKDKAMERMQPILNDIIDWVNGKDPTLEIRPEDLLTTIGGTQMVFKIKAWRDEKAIQKCKGIVLVEEMFFEDET